ncbi:MAG: carboxypeptidase regulatory-like domain-containing protein, partial [Gemmatimonadales bacterium]
MLARFFARTLGVFGLVLAVGALAARPLHAQVTIIVGTVTDPTGKPVAGARVEAFSIETEVTRPATTNDKGQYRIIFNDGGAEYRISIKAIGKSPAIYNVMQQTDDDRIILNVNLGEQATKLQDLVSNAARRPNADQEENRVTAGESTRSISGDQALRLPIDASDLAAIAALAPGVILTAGTDSTAATFSVAGQSAESNTYVVNGMTTSNSTVPPDAVRNTRVITNTYDVSRGNFSGGMVSVTTKGGSNRVSGSLSSNFQNQSLAWGGNTGNSFGAGQTNERIGGGFGGPLHRDHTFLFGSFNFTRQVSPLTSLVEADPTTLARLGATPDSVAKFEQVVDGYGLTARAGNIASNSSNNSFQGVTRFDWFAGTAHTITFTGQVRLNSREPQRIGSTQLPQVGGTSTGNSASGTMAILSRFSNGMLNSFRGSASFNDSKSAPYLYVPVGRVTNYSEVDSGQTTFTTLGFGGNAGLPNHNNTRSYEAENDLSLISPMGAHRWALGLYANASTFNQDVTNNQYGTYVYNSLSDFENNIPSSFTRTLQPSTRTGTLLNEAVYLSDAWRVRSGSSRPGTTTGGTQGAGATGGQGGGGFGGRGGGGFGGRGGGFGGRGGGGFGGPGANNGGNLQLSYGVRLEHSSYLGAPARNDAVYNEFGIDTHRLPSEWYVSP